MNIMARTIMVSNEVYNELKMRKAKRSFSELIISLLYAKKTKTGRNLISCLGTLRKDNESEKTKKALERGWEKWNKRYA